MMAKGARRVRIFSALEVANICGVVNQTAINWIRSGHLKAFTTPGGQYRIYAKDFAAFLDKREMSASKAVLQIMMENANWNTFMIAADQSVNDTLKVQIERLFPDYAIIQASDWFEIGRRFTEEKPGFVLLDAELPGGDISQFVRTIKDDPVFGKPYIFLLKAGSAGSAGAGAPAIDESLVDIILTKPFNLGKFEAAMKGLEKQLEMASA